MSATYSIMKKAELGIQGMDIVESTSGHKLVVLRMVDPFAGVHYEADKGRYTIVKGFYLQDLPVSGDEERKVEYESPINEEFRWPY
ncbi:MAG: hypothetical protein J4469_01295 [Candidatus Aenigmarchaeota archaeon]|nr:hypothetical protein [Candidatus Aenigmarchaeota archaeon]